jgi:hypothetical protein
MRGSFSLRGVSLRLSRARLSQRDASLWLRGACLKPGRAALSQRDASLWLRGASFKQRRAALSQRDASLWLRDAPFDRGRSLPSSPDAFLTHMRPRKRTRSATPGYLRSPLSLGRAFLHGGCASLKLRDARRRSTLVPHSPDEHRRPLELDGARSMEDAVRTTGGAASSAPRPRSSATFGAPHARAFHSSPRATLVLATRRGPPADMLTDEPGVDNPLLRTCVVRPRRSRRRRGRPRVRLPRQHGRRHTASVDARVSLGTCRGIRGATRL